MKKSSEKKKLFIVGLLLLMVSILVDVTKGNIKNGVIIRETVGGKEKEYEMILDAGNVLKDYEFWVKVSPINPSMEEAEEYFDRVIKEIDENFEDTMSEVPAGKTYLDKAVKADWSFSPYGIIDAAGNINYEKIIEDTQIEAQVELTCGEYIRIYSFSFLLLKPQLTEEELLLQKVNDNLKKQMEVEGNTEIKLPTEIDGNQLVWTEKREYITPQIIFLEIITAVLYVVLKKRMKKEEEQRLIQKMEQDYPDLVSQLSLLLGAGMTTRQAWNRLGMQYNFKRRNGLVEKSIVYEAILRMNGRLAEGVSERVAYQEFRIEIPAQCYHKLMRILLGTLEKGSQGVCARLEEESRIAFEQRILHAKKQGEEASTKMLGPLMLMMLVVMGIVMLPAILSF